MTDTTTDTTEANVDTNTPSLEELQNQLAAVLAEKEALANKNNELSGKYKTLSDSIKTDKKNKEQEERKKLEQVGDHEALKAHYEKELEQERNARLGYEAALVNNDRTLKITSAITEVGGNVKLLAPHVANRLKAEVDGGKVTYTVLDEAGNPMFVKGNPATIKDLVAELRSSDDFAGAFAGSGASGAGTSASAAATGSLKGNPWAKGQENFTEQQRISKENPGRAASLKAAAGVSK